MLSIGVKITEMFGLNYLDILNHQAIRCDNNWSKALHVVMNKIALSLDNYI